MMARRGERLEARVDREGDVPEDGHRDETGYERMCDQCVIGVTLAIHHRRSSLIGTFSSVSRRRADSVIAERGLARSRASAAEAIRAGRVRIGAGGQRVAKPSELIDPDAELASTRAATTSRAEA